MKAITFHGKHDLRMTSVPDPQVVNPHDAVVRVTTTAICGSDLHLYNGFLPGVKSGDVVGHEFMGEIVAVGPACEKVKVGDRVVVMCSIACGRCWFCQHQLFSGCDNSNPTGNRMAAEVMTGHAGAAVFGYGAMYGGYGGGQAEMVRVPFADMGCLQIPAELTDEQALFLGDIFPTGYMAADNCSIQRGDTIAVFGAGPVGQFAIRSALMLGAERVIAIDDVPERLSMAAEAGAIVVDMAHGEIMRRIDDLTGGRGPDACIDAVGMEAHGGGPQNVYDRMKQALKLEMDRPIALRSAIMACRKGGTVSVPGVYSGLVDKFPMGAAFAKGLTIKTGQTEFHKYAPMLLERVTSKAIDPSTIITHRMSLADIPEGYRLFNDKLDGCVKVVARVS